MFVKFEKYVFKIKIKMNGEYEAKFHSFFHGTNEEYLQKYKNKYNDNVRIEGVGLSSLAKKRLKEAILNCGDKEFASRYRNSRIDKILNDL